MLTDEDLYEIFRDQLEGPGIFTYDDALISDIIIREGARFSSFTVQSFCDLIRDLKAKRGHVLVAYWLMSAPSNSWAGVSHCPSLVEKPFDAAKEELRNKVYQGGALGSSRFPQFSTQ